jgi:hypothetical protein
MFDLHAGEYVLLFVVLVVLPLLLVGFVALGTLVARRVWRWDERREQARSVNPSP